MDSAGLLAGADALPALARVARLVSALPAEEDAEAPDFDQSILEPGVPVAVPGSALPQPASSAVQAHSAPNRTGSFVASTLTNP